MPVKVELLATNEPDDAAGGRGDPVDGARRPGSMCISRRWSLPPHWRPPRAASFEAYLIGWSGRVDIDGNT